jgi:transposase
MSGKRLSIEVRAEIAAFYPTKSMGELAKQYGVSKSTVQNIIKKKKMFGTVVDRPKSGRPRISSQRDDRRLFRMSMANRFATAGILRQMWHVNACISTVKSRLFSFGLRGCIAKRKPPLTILHRQMRLAWCQARKDWTTEQWRNVIFTDESAFSLFPNSIHPVIRRRPHEAFSPTCISISNKWRTPKVMVWGAISGAGVGPLHFCVGNVNQHVYKSILEEHVDYLSNGLMVQDNAPCHKTLLIRQWMEDNGIVTIPWPSCSPDLNPIEQVWSAMKTNIQGKRFSSKAELWTELQRIWFNFSPSFIHRYIDSMPRRVKAVIDARGGVTRF